MQVGVSITRTLDYLTPDLNLTLMTLRQGNDKVVRRGLDEGYGDITLKRSSQATPSDELIYINSCLFMAQVYGISADQFLLPAVRSSTVRALLTMGTVTSRHLQAGIHHSIGSKCFPATGRDPPVESQFRYVESISGSPSDRNA